MDVRIRKKEKEKGAERKDQGDPQGRPGGPAIPFTVYHILDAI